MKITLDEAVKSASPYLDTFGEETRRRGRPMGSDHDYGTSLELPSAAQVPDRREAQRVREKVRRRALAVLQAAAAEELKSIYRAELVLELARIGAVSGDEPAAGTVRPVPITAEAAKQIPGSGFEPGQTYWEWMKTYNDKDDEQWAREKIVAKANLARIVRGNHGN